MYSKRGYRDKDGPNLGLYEGAKMSLTEATLQFRSAVVCRG
jgi:hypothetical protein